MKDAIEGIVNGIVGLCVSVVLVAILRAHGLWETLSPWWISGVFFVASAGRSWALRRIFRGIDHAR